MRIQLGPWKCPDQLPTEYVGLYRSLSIFLLLEEGGPEGGYYHSSRATDSL